MGSADTLAIRIYHRDEKTPKFGSSFVMGVGVNSSSNCGSIVAAAALAAAVATAEAAARKQSKWHLIRHQ